MIEAKTLAYDYDEEALGFGAPPTPEDVEPPSAERLGWAHKGALALVGLGLLMLVVQCFGGLWAGTWRGLAASFGLLSLGAVLTFWLGLRGTEPGIKNDGIWFRSLLARGAAGWVGGILATGFYVLIYWFPGTLGHDPDGEPTGLVRTVDPLARLMTGDPASQWFLYGVLYTLAITVFGVRMWMKYRHSPYQKIRTLSVMFFQAAFAWLLPNLLVRFRYPYMEFNGIWPLKHDYLWPDKVAAFSGAGLIGIALLVIAVGLVVATPILTYFFGKRWYCSWVCGCGGLAETLGDPWRQLSDKSRRAWIVERFLIHGVLVAIVGLTALLWINHATGHGIFGDSTGTWQQWYGFYIGAVFAGVIGVGFYPLMGSRVWCRFGCPQAAILGLWQRFFSRFRITTNGGQCMSCGNCSTYCEMGIDVRAYAQRGENIVRASCVGCGICSAVCPRGVLKLENGATHRDRFPGAEAPGRKFLADLSSAPRQGHN